MEEQSAGPMAFKNLRSSHWHLVYEPPSSHFIGSLCEAIQCDQSCKKSFLNKIYVRRLETVLNLLWQFFTLLGSLALLKRAKYWTTIFPGLFFFIFIFSIPLTVNQFSSKIRWWLDSNHRPLVSEATALPTETQPLPMNKPCSWSSGPTVCEAFSKWISAWFLNRFPFTREREREREREKEREEINWICRFVQFIWT